LDVVKDVVKRDVTRAEGSEVAKSEEAKNEVIGASAASDTWAISSGAV
jgi:hypothetical protein